MTASVILTYAVFCDPAREHWTSQEGRVCATLANRSLEPLSPFMQVVATCKVHWRGIIVDIWGA
jgi:hypothetical protein